MIGLFGCRKKKLLSFTLLCVLIQSGLLYSQQAAVPSQNKVANDKAPVEAAVAGSPTISLDFKDAEIGTVLRVISLKSGVNIVAGPEVTGTITIRLEDVPWQKALDVILRTYNYVYEKDENVIRVTTRDKMQQEPVDTKTFILNYSKASEIQASIQDILTERGRVKVAERMNMLVVTDIPTNIFQISQVIERLDKKTAQAYIDSKIVNTEAGVAENLGIDWNVRSSLSGAARPTTFPFTTPGDGENLPASIAQFFPRPAAAATVNPGNPRDFPLATVASPAASTYTYGSLSFSNFAAALQMLTSNTRTKVVSNPRVVVLNNQEASVQVGSQIPIPAFERNENTGSMEVSGFTYRDVGVVMKVTPHINDANEILVDLKPEVSSRGSDVAFQADFSAPSFNVTQAQTQVLIQSGETIAIGGLLTDNDDMTETKVPYLGDIPFVGKALFKSKRQTPGSANKKSETIFFVTVTSVDSQGQPISGTSSRQGATSSQNQASSPAKKSASSETSSVAGKLKSAA